MACKRLAFLALKNDYGRDDIVAESPSLQSVEQLGNRLKITFQNTGGALETRDGKAPNGFQIIGIHSRGYQEAKAVIEQPEEPSESIFDRIWALPTLYKNDENAFLQEFKLIGRYQLQYANVDSPQGSYSDWQTRRWRIGGEAKLFNMMKVLRYDQQWLGQVERDSGRVTTCWVCGSGRDRRTFVFLEPADATAGQ